MFYDGCDSTSMSGGTSATEENDSDFSERCVTGNSSQDFASASCSKSLEVDINENKPIGQPMNFRDCDGRNVAENSEGPRPLFSIKFRNEIIARKYKESVKKFLKELITKHDSTVEDCDVSDLELDIWEDSSNEGKPHAENSPLCTVDVDMARKEIVKHNVSKPIAVDEQKECITVPDDTDLFVIDTRPTARDGRDVPYYRQPRSFKMLVETETKTEEISASNASPKRSVSCFNCKGSHSLRDCPKPRNQSNINRNRRDFTFAGKQSGRYHVDDDQKYASFVPGKISDDLRRALGLRKNELPKHIYRMRLLGYPPGWLAAAKVRYSGISVFDERGKEVLNSDDEEGELISEEMKVKYDPSKIIKFPGFNVLPPPDTRDDSRHYRCPPMSEDQSLESMLGLLGPAYMGGKRCRKKAVQAVLAVTPRSQSDLDLTAADMDVDAQSDASLRMLPSSDNCRFIPPLPIGTPPHLPPPPPSETPPRPAALSSMESDSEGADTRSLGALSPFSTRGCSLQGHSSVSSPRVQSPSLSELESKKELLLAELEDGASSDAGSTVTTPRVATSRAIGTTTHHTPITLGKVKNVNFGTPLLNSCSPFKRLPETIKFSKDISDIINFENLPESTGAYEKMSGLIQKVRKTISHEHE